MLRALPRAAIDSSLDNKAKQLIDSILRPLENPNADLGDKDKELQEEGIELAYDLLCKIAKVSSSTIVELSEAMSTNDIGYTHALVDQINRQLAANLNFPKYWLQDSEFRLLISAKDHNLEFSIIDRTRIRYSFEERSSGLKYFLSYFIQHRAYEAPDNVPEILLMDEPDTYLSNQAQQDLLKIFEEATNSEPNRPASQVIYVTHSPFLIDKNHAERIRVLKKGNDYEGTQVVKSAVINRYEPLRSALGAFVAETVYIGQCNLMVEGPVDQVLLAGAATYLLRYGVSEIETLNLNEITIVPAGGTGNVPYMTYLARGRDTEQADVIVLLDSDSDGNNAKKELVKKEYGLKKKALLQEKYVIQIGDLAEHGVEFPKSLKEPQMEDLIPVFISVLAARKHAKEICGMAARDIEDITEENIQKDLDAGVTMFKAVNTCVGAASKDKPHLEKLPFARGVIEAVHSLRKKENRSSSETKALETFERNFKILFREIDKLKSMAEVERSREKASEQVKDLEELFFNNHPTGAYRDVALAFIEKLETLLAGDDTFKADSIKKGIEAIRKKHCLETDFSKRIEDYEVFKEEVQRLKVLGDLDSEQNTDLEDV